MMSQKRVTDLCPPEHPFALQVTQNRTTGGMFHLVYSNSSNELDNPHNTLISIVVYQCRLQVRLQYCPVLHTLQEIILYIPSCGLLLYYSSMTQVKRHTDRCTPSGQTNRWNFCWVQRMVGRENKISIDQYISIITILNLPYLFD